MRSYDDFFGDECADARVKAASLGMTVDETIRRAIELIESPPTVVESWFRDGNWEGTS